jgi:predicted DCC family thiol-disulfide oxidoreductase YuxK
MAENEHISRAAGNGAPAQIRPADRSGSGDTRPVVFYDGGCPLCRREIAHYRRLRGAADLRWVDVVGEPDNLEKFGLSVEAAMQELHVRDADGRWQRGVDAFLIIWRHLPRYRWLAWLVSGTGLRAPLAWAYRRFAARRYRQRCDAGACMPAGSARGR